MAPLPSIDIDVDASPAASVDSMDTNTTPDTEFSPPESPFCEHEGFMKDKIMAARKKLGQLTQEEKVRPRFRSSGSPCESLLTRREQVSLLTAADFWRTKAIPEKNIPAVKTSDGPNGARGGIFVGGTKVSQPESERLLLFPPPQ